MSFREVLVVLRPYPAQTPTSSIDLAVAAARALHARASAIACAVKPQIPGHVLGKALFDVSTVVAQEGKKSEEDARKLLATFEDAARKHCAFGKRILETCRPSDVPALLADHARLYDLTILPMSEDSRVAELDARWYVETIIFGSGRPAIVLPSDRKASDRFAFDTVIVAWDKSRAAARAIADALPVLQTANRVLLLTVTGEKTMVSNRSGVELAAHLGQHRVDVVIEEVEARGRPIGEVLVDEVHRHGADLLVMGAYGRSRLREFILGGATKSMLAHPPTALFMAH